MFRFKQFTVNQDKAAMKIGTDGVLLGAWATVGHDPYSVLDIGTGTGLIALMLAQRCDAPQIDAIEIDENAYEQAVDNFEESPWNDRLFCFHASLDQFMDELEDEEYDLIVSNPPFYTEHVASGNGSRDAARQNESLPFADLFEAAGILLSEGGILCLIAPHKQEENLISLAAREGLHLLKITRVKGRPESEIKRILLAFSRIKKDNVPVDELIIETERHVYTEEYHALTGDFYIKM